MQKKILTFKNWFITRYSIFDSKIINTVIPDIKIKLTKRFFTVTALLGVLLAISGCMSILQDTKPETRNLLDLIDYFDHHNLKAEKIIPVRFQTLHASDGCILIIKGTRVEVYVYNSAIESQRKKLEKIKKNKSIQVLSLTVPVVVNGGMVMLVYSKDPQVSAIIKAFKSFPSDYKSKYRIK